VSFFEVGGGLFDGGAGGGEQVAGDEGTGVGEVSARGRETRSSGSSGFPKKRGMPGCMTAEVSGVASLPRMKR
jgi:hypothetical protein